MIIHVLCMICKLMIWIMKHILKNCFFLSQDEKGNKKFPRFRLQIYHWNFRILTWCHMHKKTQIRVHFGLKFSAKSWPHLTMELVCVVHVSIYKEKNYPKIFFFKELKFNFMGLAKCWWNPFQIWISWACFNLQY